MRHHLAHAASAFFSSPFREAAFYTMDQRGEWDTTLWGRCEGKTIDVLGIPTNNWRGTTVGVCTYTLKKVKVVGQ